MSVNKEYTSWSPHYSSETVFKCNEWCCPWTSSSPTPISIKPATHSSIATQGSIIRANSFSFPAYGQHLHARSSCTKPEHIFKKVMLTGRWRRQTTAAHLYPPPRRRGLTPYIRYSSNNWHTWLYSHEPQRIITTICSAVSIISWNLITVGTCIYKCLNDIYYVSNLPLAW